MTSRAAQFDVLFQRAVATIDVGDVGALATLLAQYPDLVRQRLESPGPWLRDTIGSALDGFFRRPYLLWLLTEDAVRVGALPPRVAELARTIISAARRENVPDLHEQLNSTLHFTVCSAIGREGGGQLDLLDVLVDAGASLAGAAEQALICRNAAAANHLLMCGAPLTLSVAATLERMDDLPRLAATATRDEKQTALALAALNGAAKGVAALIPLAVDVCAFSTGFYTHATPLHHAVWSGSLETVRVLVEAGASLTTKDTAEHATPLGWAEYAMTQSRMAGAYGAIAAYLRGQQEPATRERAGRSVPAG